MQDSCREGSSGHQVHTSVGGDRVRVKVSNAFGTAPVLIAHTTVGLQGVVAG